MAILEFYLSLMPDYMRPTLYMLWVVFTVAVVMLFSMKWANEKVEKGDYEERRGRQR